MDSYEEMIIPEVPKVLPNEQLFIYVPIASNDNPGVAKFDNEHFSVDPDGTVHCISMITAGDITISSSQWTDDSPTMAQFSIPPLENGQVIIIMPANDTTKRAAVQARLSMYPNPFTSVGEHIIYFIRAKADGVPTVDMNFIYLVFKIQSADTSPVVALIGVDAYGETEEPTSVDLSGFAPNENGKGSIVETYADRTVVTELTYDDTGRIIKIGDTTLEWGEEE